MSDLAGEQEIKDYWDNINNKTTSIIKVLKGCSHQECQQIIKTLNQKIEMVSNNLILFK